MRGSRVFGVLVVRDEVDVVRLCVLHHLALGCERILALDNGSTDGTATVLARLAARVPLSWTADPGDFRQPEFATGLAKEAARAGADWVLPLDADEFWLAPGGLHASLAPAADAGAAEVDRVELIQQRGRRRPTPAGVLTMTRRVPDPTPDWAAIDVFRAGRGSMFEVRQGPKLAMRASPGLQVDRGGHSASGLPGTVVPAAAMTILHAPLRSRACLARKAEHGARLEHVGVEGLQGWQVRHWAALQRTGGLDAAWAAHAYGPDGALHVDGRRVALVHDDRLAHALRRWVRPRAAQLAARALRKTY